MSDDISTTEDYPPRAGGARTPRSPDSFVPEHRVVAGGGSRLASETRWLLQQRLRAASLVLVVGFGLFLIRALILYPWESSTVLFHGLLLAMPLLSLVILSSSWRPTLKELRIFEVGFFATIIVFFMTAEYTTMLRALRRDDSMALGAAVKSNVLWMLLLVFNYTIFIPNNWRRAAKVVVPMALAPVAVPWLLGQAHHELYEVAVRTAKLGQISENALFLFLGAFTAIFGSHIISTLRTEAHAARMLNQYRLGRRLGGGGMGEVFLAEHQMLKRPCAIKLIRQEQAGDPHAMARFEREVRATAQLSHWNTIEIFDYGRNDDDTFYYVMEYLPGLSLDILVHRHGPMPPARVIYLLRQACDALNEAHEAGLVHRDIKPGNLFASYRGGHYDVAKLLDFGLVKALQVNDAIQLSREDTVVGSPLYVAPEQVVHVRPPDRRADIYSLGAVAYFLLTGKPPFHGRTAMEVMIAHTRDPLVPPSRLRTEVPADLEQVVLRCLEKRPDDRFPDTPSLAEALAACSDAAKWSSRLAADWWQSREDLPTLPGDESLASTRDSERSAEQGGETTSTTQSVEAARVM